MSLRPFSRRILAALLAAGIAANGCSVSDHLGDMEDQMEGLGPANPLPLEGAAAREDLERVEQLLANGADPNDGVYSSPLMAVVDDWEPSALADDVAQTLLEHGADVDYGGIVGTDQTPLHRAAMMNSADLVALLLTAGADPCREVSNPSDFRGMTALDIALEKNNSAAALELTEASSTCR